MSWLAGLLSGIIGAMGLGGGAVLIIYLAIFTDTPQLKAQGINLIFFIPIGLAAVLIYAFKMQINGKITLIMSLGGLIGAVAGVLVSEYIGGNFTAKIFGGLLIALGIKEMFLKNKA